MDRGCECTIKIQVLHIYLKPTTKSARKEFLAIVESTKESVARNCSCVMTRTARVAEGLRKLTCPRFAMRLVGARTLPCCCIEERRAGKNVMSCEEAFVRAHYLVTPKISEITPACEPSPMGLPTYGMLLIFSFFRLHPLHRTSHVSKKRVV